MNGGRAAGSPRTALWRPRSGAGRRSCAARSGFFRRSRVEDAIRAGAKRSMDGRRRYLDNVFIERLWRSLEYEAVYLHELCDGFEAEHVIAN